MKSPKVSILVPIYNTEKYLDEALKSLTAQTLTDTEIILINDGSTDGSSKIIQQYATSDKRIKVITKKNTGYGDSMNQGLKTAKGEYVGILEPDDFAEPDMFKTLYSLAHKFNADMAKGNYYFHQHGQDKISQIIKPDEAGKLIDPLKNQHIFHQPPDIWSAIYRRDFLIKHNINFLPTPGAAYQDVGFNFKVLASTHRVVYTTKPVMHYRTDNANSSVKSTAKVFAVSKEFASVEEFLKNHKIYQTYAPIMQATKFGSYHWNLLRLPEPALQKFLPAMRQEFLDAKKAGILQKRYFPTKHWLTLNLLLKSPSAFLRAFRIYSKI
ncbi:glycosyltransferase [Candidatus Saccharibacteria bacterium]|nr:glycosyltransferase [Candidatus Saccharibacteria bacterium]